MGALEILLVADVSPVGPQGGAERFLQAEAQALAARGHAVRLLCRTPTGASPGGTRWEGLPLTHVGDAGATGPAGILQTLTQTRALVQQILACRPIHLVHCHQPFTATAVAGPVRQQGIPLCYTFHSPAPLEYRIRIGMTPAHTGGIRGGCHQAALWLLERHALRQATQIHVLRAFAAGQIQTLYNVQTPICKIPGGADTARFHPVRDRVALKRTLGWPTDIPTLFTVRNLEHRMGLDLLIQAMDLLRRWEVPARLVLGGTGSLRDALAQQIRNLNLADRVQMLGFIPDADLPRYFQAADLFVLPTRALEGCGLVTVEALACGTPVLGTPVGGTPEILEPLDPDCLFSRLTPDAMAADLAHWLRRLAQDPAEAEAFRDTCRAHAEKHYCWTATLGTLASLLERLATRRTDGRR